MPTIERELSEFEAIKDAVKVDARGRIVLGRDYAGKNYRVSRSANGEILLTPVVMVPEEDAWLYRNPEALAAVRLGLEEARLGKVGEPVDYSQYANLDIDDDIEE